eukprot:CAMPEP_0201596932 /NCGR_PEP_ID=MMETSP0190_2-20130828/193526_1 /ASSEMBLY_ACC=CAM_ASM_000263 /TAXON_ID=37353 /ORGANISM="Rosalina sp." /LENGTH=107 /DNA_ID=CAMNT_0048057597 /DNA_START=1225 /DNA_END=1545 /DNA_ORIENTATION=-
MGGLFQHLPDIETSDHDETDQDHEDDTKIDDHQDDDTDEGDDNHIVMMFKQNHHLKKKKMARICELRELPEYYNGYPFLPKGYRLNYDYKQAIQSIFSWHNETMNMW